jgi:hypothetical protein
MNSATTCHVVYLPNVVYEPHNSTTHPAKLAGQLVMRSTEEALYAFSREDSVSDRGTAGHW